MTAASSPLNGHHNGHHKDRHSLPPSAIQMYHMHSKPPPKVYRSSHTHYNHHMHHSRPPIPIVQSFSPPAYAPLNAKRSLHPLHPPPPPQPHNHSHSNGDNISPSMPRQLTYSHHHTNSAVNNNHHNQHHFTFSGVQRGQSSPQQPQHSNSNRPSSSPSPFRSHFVASKLSPLHHDREIEIDIEEQVNDIHIGSPPSPSPSPSPRPPPPPPPNFPPPPDTLPLGWAKLPDGDGAIYYFNVITGEKQRQRPIADATANIPGNRPLAIADVDDANDNANANGAHIVASPSIVTDELSVAELEYRKHNGSMVFAELMKGGASESQQQLRHHENWDLLVDAIYLNLNDDDYVQVFKALRSIAENLFEEDEQKYRVLYADNKKVQQRILTRVGGYEFLRGLGFRELSKRKLICDAPDLNVLLTAITAVNAKLQALEEKEKQQNKKKKKKQKQEAVMQDDVAQDMDVDEYMLVAGDADAEASIRELSMDEMVSDAIKSPRKPALARALAPDPQLEPGSPSVMQHNHIAQSAQAQSQAQVDNASVTYHDVDDQEEKQPVLPASNEMDTESGYEAEGGKKAMTGGGGEEEDDEKVGILYNANGEEQETDAGITQTREYLKNLHSEHDDNADDVVDADNGHANVNAHRPRTRYKIIPKHERHLHLKRPIATLQSAYDSDELSISEMSREFARHKQPPPQQQQSAQPPPPLVQTNVPVRKRSSSTGSERERARSHSHEFSKSVSKKKVASMDDIEARYHGYARQRDMSRDIAAIDRHKQSSGESDEEEEEVRASAVIANHNHMHGHDDTAQVVASNAYPYHINSKNNHQNGNTVNSNGSGAPLQAQQRIYYQTPPLIPRRPQMHSNAFSEDRAHRAASSVVNLAQMDHMPPAMLKPVGILSADELKKIEKKWRKKQQKKAVGKRMSNFLNSLTLRGGKNPKYTSEELNQIAIVRQQQRRRQQPPQQQQQQNDDSEYDDEFYADSPIMTPNKLSPNLSAHPSPNLSHYQQQQQQQLSPMSLNAPNAAATTTDTTSAALLRSVDVYFEDALKVTLQVNADIAAIRLVSLALAKRQWNAKMAPMYALSIKDEIVGHFVILENDMEAVSMFAEYVVQYNMVAPKFVVSYKQR